MVADPVCDGLTSNAGLGKFGLRISELDLSAPAAFASSIVHTTVLGGVEPSEASCNLNGTGMFSWLLQFDTAAHTLKTGGAKPVADPTQGYQFDDETITSGTTPFHVQPVSASVTVGGSGSFTMAAGEDLVMPIFLDDTGTNVLLLPLRQARITAGTLSSHNDCIGSYNAAGLDPASSCMPDATHPQFLDAAAVDAFILLTDADEDVVSDLQESLCVLLSQDSATYGMAQSGTGITVCKRNTQSQIVFKGDWCSTTNSAATSTCSDSVHVAGQFAAASVLITN